jgi:hypothetical protein
MAVWVLLVLMAPACLLYKLEQQLAPQDQEFLSQVGYIITKEERKDFLALADAERPQFIEEFWSGNFPVIFVDTHCNGNYILATLNLQHLHDLNMAQATAQNTIFSEKKPVVDFDLTIRMNPQAGSRVEGLVVIEIPIIVNEAAAPLRQGKNRIQVVLKNKTGMEELRKVVEFSL